MFLATARTAAPAHHTYPVPGPGAYHRSSAAPHVKPNQIHNDGIGIRRGNGMFGEAVRFPEVKDFTPQLTMTRSKVYEGPDAEITHQIYGDGLEDRYNRIKRLQHQAGRAREHAQHRHNHFGGGSQTARNIREQAKLDFLVIQDISPLLNSLPDVHWVCHNSNAIVSY
jgi:hypothetical protein